MRQTTYLAGVLLAIALSAPDQAAAQARSSVEMSTVGRGTVLGDTSQSQDFRRYSTGLGSLGGRGSGGGTNVLRSSLSSSSLGGLRFRTKDRYTSDSSSMDSLGRPTLTRGADYSSPVSSLSLSASRMGNYRGIAEDAAADPLFGTKAYLQAMGATANGVRKGSEPVTSLVPAAPSQYRDYLANGERAFKAAKFILAMDMFELANVYNGDDPESLLSIFHTKVALSEFGSAGFALRKALRGFPELPLVPIRPKAFYGDQADYREHMASLQKYIRRSDSDPAGHLILAYYKWYEGDVEATTTALQSAHRSASASQSDVGKDSLEAIDTFWKAMVASGEVSGELMPSEVETTTQEAPLEDRRSTDTDE